MNKRELINECIDLSYVVSKEEMQDAINQVTTKGYMEVSDGISYWEELYYILSDIASSEKGNKVLFNGKNVEEYRQDESVEDDDEDKE